MRYKLLNEALSACLRAALNGDNHQPEQYEVFEVLPIRSEMPEYYRQIKTPIDLETVREKIAA